MADTLTLIEKTVHMKSSDVFRAIPTEPLAQLAARAKEVMLDRGETVFREGDDDQGVFIVIEGVVELRKGNAVVRVLGSGTVHGELFLQESGAHQYTAVAREVYGDAAVFVRGFPAEIARALVALLTDDARTRAAASAGSVPGAPIPASRNASA